MDWRSSDSGVRWLEAKLGPATVAFPARMGGASEGPYSSLNLGISTGDDPEAVAENRRRLMAALELERAPVATARQVHGDRILRHVPGEDGASLDTDAWAAARPVEEEADAHVTKSSRVALVVLTADCVPVAVHGRGGLGLAHCGWRGLATGLAREVAEEVHAEGAAIGPSIGPCCYSVGPEVAATFEGLPGAVADDRLDLRAVARAQLESAGVTDIHESDLCTSCAADDLFSHRRDGPEGGRGGAVAWLS